MASKTTIDYLGTDLLENIVSRLPAFSFACADCVSRSWHHVCGRFLCRPKLSSACSFNPSLQVAVEDVVNKVLSEPIRPQFAIVCVRHVSSEMQKANQLITAKLSSKIPVIFNFSRGIIGTDAISDEFKEGLWVSIGNGIMLTVGFTPGLKVKSISLLKQSQDSETFLIDQFITDIREFSTCISGCQSPSAIMIFGGEIGMRVVMEKMDYAISPETVIVGECNYGFRHTALTAAVALVFVKDKNKPGIGETKFHAVLSSGLSPVGATYTVDFVRESPGGCLTYLTGVREGPFETDEVYSDSTVCIGVTKRRMCSIGQEDAKWMTSLAYHNIRKPQRGEYPLFVEDVGIKTGDSYRFYRQDSCVGGVSNLLRSLKLDVCGCFIFSSWRNVPPNADRSAFLENFPGVTFGGVLCSAEIGRGYLTPQESPEHARACLHEYSAVYFIMSYAP